MTKLHTTLHPSPLGPIRLDARDDALVGLRFEPPGGAPAGPIRHPLLAEAATQLDAWFEGRRLDFELPLALEGTDFQRAVWAALRALPYGATTSYAELARAVGRPKAVRAVGAANGRNPISLIVPCHRVIGASGALTGYRFGVERKRWLLAHEAEVLGRGRRAAVG
jgi:methylated-DNA-[protein]-cysteine S-methyltransferase